MKPINKIESAKYPTLQESRDFARKFAIPIGGVGLILGLSACSSSYRLVELEMNVPNVDVSESFECISKQELKEYYDREYQRRDFDDGIVAGGSIDGKVYHFNVPKEQFIVVRLKDGSDIGYQLSIHFKKSRDGKIIRENIEGIIKDTNDEIFLHVPGRMEMPEIDEYMLRQKVRKKIEEKYRLKGWFDLKIISSCDFFI